VVYLQQVSSVHLKKCNAVKQWARYKGDATSQQKVSLEKNSHGLIQGFFLLSPVPQLLKHTEDTKSTELTELPQKYYMLLLRTQNTSFCLRSRKHIRKVEASVGELICA